jgi:hypothetical protein
MPTPDRYLHRAPSDIPYFSSDGETYLAQTPLRDLQKSRKLRVLSEEDFDFWQTYGYVIVKEAVPTSVAERLLEFTWDFQGLDPARPDSWYSDRLFRSDLDRELHIYGFVEAYHHQLIWDNRQAQRVYDAFVDVWDCEELWVTLDRLNLNPPNIKNRDRALIAPTDKGFDIELHWDVDSTLSVPPQSQNRAVSSAHPSCSVSSTAGRPFSRRTGTLSGPRPTGRSFPWSDRNSRPATC